MLGHAFNAQLKGRIETMKPDYKTNDPRGWCGDPRRGAAMGRPTIHDAPTDAPVKLHLRRVRLDSGGYDCNGTYFGHGDPLYWYADADGTIDAVLRATNRSDAKRQIREDYPQARFYN
jgi:hypothetical protein